MSDLCEHGIQPVETCSTCCPEKCLVDRADLEAAAAAICHLKCLISQAGAIDVGDHHDALAARLRAAAGEGT